MKKFNKNSIVSSMTLTVSVVSLMLPGLTGPMSALAATNPPLGVLSTYGVVSETFTNSNTAPYTIINGTASQPALCYTTLSTVGPTSMTGTTLTPCSAAVDSAQTAALADVNAQVIASCTSLGGGAVNLNAVDVGSGLGIFPPGCYTNGGAMNITTGTTVTLTGSGTHIFKPGGALTTEADTNMILSGGASACDVFWAPVGGTTLGAYTGALPNTISTFVGSIFRGNAAGLSITIGQFTNLLGRAFAFGSTVTTDANTITVPTCSSPTPTPSASGPTTGTINVVKLVINNNGGTATFSDFPLFINGMSVTSGVTNTFSAPAPAFTVTETGNANYAVSFSGDCDMNGQLNLSGGDNKFCIVTNDDIGVGLPNTGLVPPLINVVKVPSPLALPGGPGPVMYTYTLRNIGTVPVTDITMVGDTCSPIVLVSGDTNGDARMDVNETWVHTCTTLLSATHTNTVVATGWANGISAVDIASSTVVVGLPVVPPLIHLVKMPSSFALSSSGPVTYTFTVTNPGTVPLSNVAVSDNKCSPASAHSGDVNGNNMLDVSETWTYSCQTNLSSNTVNTATATGMANGLTATDVSVATVLVTPPGFPSTGIASNFNNILWSIIALAGIVTVSVVARRKQLI